MPSRSSVDLASSRANRSSLASFYWVCSTVTWVNRSGTATHELHPDFPDEKMTEHEKVKKSRVSGEAHFRTLILSCSKEENNSKKDTSLCLAKTLSALSTG